MTIVIYFSLRFFKQYFSFFISKNMKKQTKKGFTYFYEQNFKVEKLSALKTNQINNKQIKKPQTENQVKRWLIG